MVRNSKALGFLQRLIVHLPERWFRRDFWHTLRHISPNEQHGKSPRLSLAVVHYLLNICLLVFHNCMVVQTVIEYLRMRDGILCDLLQSNKRGGKNTTIAKNTVIKIIIYKDLVMCRQLKSASFALLISQIIRSRMYGILCWLKLNSSSPRETASRTEHVKTPQS